MMTTLTKYMKKTTAIAMAAMVLSLPLASVASAHGRHTPPPPPPPRHSDSYYKHHHYDKYHKNDNYVTKKDSNKKATTSFIIGAVLGAVIAKNTYLTFSLLIHKKSCSFTLRKIVQLQLFQILLYYM